MTPGAPAVGAFLASAGASAVLTPVMERVASATGVVDHPGGHKEHAAPTPCLGGPAVLGAFALGTAAHRAAAAPVGPALAIAAGLCAIGVADDRHTVDWRLRLVASGLAGVVAYEAGAAVEVTGHRLIDQPLTVAWVTGLTVAFNLMDNLDGSCATVTAVSGAGTAMAAATLGNRDVAVAAAALSGACVGFLPSNLAAPRARIFLGDGGSMPLGALVAMLAAATTQRQAPGPTRLLSAAMLAGLPILDTTLVSISRRRRKMSILNGGRDHLNHRLLRLTGTPRRTAVVLATGQTGLAALAATGVRSAPVSVRRRAKWAVGAGIAVIAALEAAPITRP